MNERIRELAKDAELDWHTHWHNDDSNRLAEFAESIVRECCQVVADIPIDALEPDYRILADHFGIDFERDWS